MNEAELTSSPLANFLFPHTFILNQMVTNFEDLLCIVTDYSYTG